jgi:acyl carrier protein phosphodiesterase
MNFLAHAYLSFDHPGILVGNMISDFVKGKAKFSFSPGIQAGMDLHRAIDDFTDHHAATKKAKAVFHHEYRLYSGAVMDVIYDHYLASDGRIFSDEGLKNFSRGIYDVLERNTAHLPIRFAQMLLYMKTEDWLYHYRFDHGMKKSLSGLVRRAAYLSDSAPAFRLFTEHYAFLKDCYDEFIPDVKSFAKQQFGILSSRYDVS